MAETPVHLRIVPDTTLAVAWAGARTLTIDRSERSGGSGRGFGAGELLRLAIGACYAISLQREATRRGIALTRVEIDVQAAWAGDPERAEHMRCIVAVDAEASATEIGELIRHADQTAEVTNSVRAGTPVTVIDARGTPDEAQPLPNVTAAPEADAVLEMVGLSASAGAACCQGQLTIDPLRQLGIDPP